LQHFFYNNFLQPIKNFKKNGTPAILAEFGFHFIKYREKPLWERVFVEHRGTLHKVGVR